MGRPSPRPWRGIGTWTAYATITRTAHFSSQHPTDQAWGYRFDGDLNGNPDEEPAIGALTYYDEGDATVSTYTLHGVTLTVPSSLGPDELVPFTVLEVSEERLELADSTPDPFEVEPRYYHEVYRRGLP